MIQIPTSKDLAVLSADKNTQFALRGILARYQSLGIRPVKADFFVHPEKDPGVYRNADVYLRVALRTHAHALVLMDRVGSGKEEKSRQQLETELEQALSRSGWKDQAAAVVLDPELEAWVWSDSPHVDREMGWFEQQKGLRSWLTDQGFLERGSLKPAKPKEAMEAALKAVRKPRSSAIYQALAEKVGLTKCQDPAFLKLKEILKAWFSKPT